MLTDWTAIAVDALVSPFMGQEVVSAGERSTAHPTHVVVAATVLLILLLKQCNCTVP